MANQSTPLSEQFRIVLFGLRNSGKSSLINHLFGNDIAIVSDQPGTTTDPVTRSLELLPVGPVAITDTAGIDDEGDIGSLRTQKSLERLKTGDLLTLVTRADIPPSDIEKNMLLELSKNKAVTIAVTFTDQEWDKEKEIWLKDKLFAGIDNIHKTGIPELKKLWINLAKEQKSEITPMENLVNENDLVILVTPIDLAAPKGRLILPQVETIRDLLDKDCAALVVKERELKYFYDSLPIKPKLVVTDSQAFNKVAADIPESQMLTSFSILFARKKGDLSLFIEGIKALDRFPAGGKVLILESCAHHKQADDIGSVKIPRLFRQLVAPQAEFSFAHGIPEESELKKISLVINCGGCMVTRNQVLQNLALLKTAGIPVTNYGLFLAWANGLLPRALEAFPMEYESYKSRQ